MDTMRIVLRLIFLFSVIGITAVWVYTSYSQTIKKPSLSTITSATLFKTSTLMNQSREQH